MVTIGRAWMLSPCRRAALKIPALMTDLLSQCFMLARSSAPTPDIGLGLLAAYFTFRAFFPKGMMDTSESHATALNRRYTWERVGYGLLAVLNLGILIKRVT